jgi:hypothetical protein
VPHVVWYWRSPRQAMLRGIVVGRGCGTPHIPTPDYILLSNDAGDPEITNTLTELFNHRLAHQAYPPQTFPDLTLPRPVQFTFVILNVRFVLFVS